jgi:uncharacterized surface anchored protein
MDRLLTGADEEPYYVTTGNILKNDKIWRIIRNGYPFKTAKEWGLSADYNLYAVTRFAIYCVLGQAELDYFYAEKDDPEAIKMLDVLKQLVDIGENGTETPDTNPLSTEKVGNFKESGDYYIQEYKVNSTSDFNEYKISKITGLPDGAYIADSDGNPKATFSKGENFYVQIPKTQLTKDIDIKIDISAECKVYIVLEGKTTVKNTQNYAVTAGEYSTATTSVEFKTIVNTGKVQISKVDEDTNEPIEGVEFQLLDEKENVVNTQTTDANGTAKFENLVQGKYTLVETKTDERYILSEQNYNIEVEYNKTTSVNIGNEHKKRKFKDLQSR